MIDASIVSDISVMLHILWAYCHINTDYIESKLEDILLKGNK